MPGIQYPISGRTYQRDNIEKHVPVIDVVVWTDYLCLINVNVSIILPWEVITLKEQSLYECD